ncbi:MAG: LodA/GoxA family CTQ-dependent oxidase [Acidobacteriota bacterium]
MPVNYRIHPAIGVARVGDSPDDYFIGPEAPGVAPSLRKPGDASTKPGTYKDRQQRIKRQGARFRVYEYTTDAAGAVSEVREITAATARIDWEVHLVNGKAAEQTRFFPVRGRTLRNKGVDRAKLLIDPGPQRISGVSQGLAPIAGTFMDKVKVKLGDLLTDAEGRLIVLGGLGTSQSFDGRRLSEDEDDFADNDGWCDDTSDGSIRATITLKAGGAAVAADSAWLIVAPPDFAPPIGNVVTLWDRVYDMAATFDRSLAVTATSPVSFTTDIYPILKRATALPWVSDFADSGHGKGSGGEFMAQLPGLADNDPKNGARQHVFQHLQNPKGGGGNMPQLGTSPDIPGIALTASQYQRMTRWAKGTFTADWKGAAPVPPPFESLSEKDRPAALDRAALEPCVGGPFFPGIEVGRIMLDKTTFEKKRPFRINTARHPGELTARMAVPWQADFFACECDRDVTMDWWPGQRPDAVQRGLTRAQWRLGVSGMNDMVALWSKLGFVAEKTVKGEVTYVEVERSFPPALKA